MLDVRFGAQFKKDLKLAKKRHLDIDLLKTIVNRLRAGEPLDESQRDHELTAITKDTVNAIFSRIGCWCTKSSRIS